MRAVVQRVTEAKVTVKGETVGSIAQGLVIFLGVGREDDEKDCAYLAEKVAGLRVFEDDKGLMNRSVAEAGGSILVISQFTLYGDCRKGRRPSFIGAAPPGEAERLYRVFCEMLRQRGLTVATGRFQAAMQVSVHNDGPVTILLDSKKLF